MLRSMSRVMAVTVVAFSLFLVTAPAAQAKPGKLGKPRAAQQETLLERAMAWLSGIVLISVTGADEEPVLVGDDDDRLYGGPCIDPLGRPCEDVQP